MSMEKFVCVHACAYVVCVRHGSDFRTVRDCQKAKLIRINCYAPCCRPRNLTQYLIEDVVIPLGIVDRYNARALQQVRPDRRSADHASLNCNLQHMASSLSL